MRICLVRFPDPLVYSPSELGNLTRICHIMSYYEDIGM